jgi:hypothetical protein
MKTDRIPWRRLSVTCGNSQLVARGACSAPAGSFAFMGVSAQTHRLSPPTRRLLEAARVPAGGLAGAGVGEGRTAATQRLGQQRLQVWPPMPGGLHSMRPQVSSPLRRLPSCRARAWGGADHRAGAGRSLPMPMPHGPYPNGRPSFSNRPYLSRPAGWAVSLANLPRPDCRATAAGECAHPQAGDRRMLARHHYSSWTPCFTNLLL